MRILLPLLFIVTLSGCLPQGPTEDNMVEAALIKRLLEHPEVVKMQGEFDDGAIQLAPLPNSICDRVNCQELLETAGAKVKLWDYEEAFSRTIIPLVIYDISIDPNNGFISFSIGASGLMTISY